MFVLRVVTTGCQQHPHGCRGRGENDVSRHACLDSIHTWNKSSAKGGGNALGLNHAGVHCCKRCEATHLADGDCDTANNSSCCLACACRTLGSGGGRLRALTLVRCHVMSIPVGDTKCPSQPICSAVLGGPAISDSMPTLVGVPHSPIARQCWVGSRNCSSALSWLLLQQEAPNKPQRSQQTEGAMVCALHAVRTAWCMQRPG
jgi:hypothetical protein